MERAAPAARWCGAVLSCRAKEPADQRGFFLEQTFLENSTLIHESKRKNLEPGPAFEYSGPYPGLNVRILQSLRVEVMESVS